MIQVSVPDAVLAIKNENFDEQGRSYGLPKIKESARFIRALRSHSRLWSNGKFGRIRSNCALGWTSSRCAVG